MNGLVPEKRRDKNGVLRTVYVRPGHATKSGASLPAPTAAVPKKPRSPRPAKPTRVGPEELAEARRAMLSRIREVDDRFATRHDTAAGFARCLQRLALNDPETFRALGERIAVSDPYELKLHRSVLQQAMGRGMEQPDEVFTASMELNVLVASTVATLNPDEGGFTGTSRGNQLRNLLATSLNGVRPLPGTDRLRAILLANWAYGFNSGSWPLEPTEHTADLQFIEEHIDTLLARRDFIAARLPGFGKMFREVMAVLRVTVEGSASAALLDGAL